MPQTSAEEDRVLPADLIQHLNHVLVDLHQHPYPDVESPPGVPKRASVALIIRINPNYSNWPARKASEDGLNEQSQFISVEDRVNAFFKQDWVQHGDPEVLFIKRAARQGDKWNSHVAFPGGRRDPEDADDRAAAIREAWEEVGIDLSEEHAISTGNLPQRIVTTAWGSKAYETTDARSYGLMTLADHGRRLMTLCPYVFLVTAHEIPPLKLQPTEVASTHWVPLRALLSRKQRTYWYQDMSRWTNVRFFGLTHLFNRWLLGDMMFAAVKLVPSESKFCSSIGEFLQEEPLKHEPETLNHTVPIVHWEEAPPNAALLLWGLTLGVMGDFLDMLPPHNALQIWTYPTFTRMDVRFILWALSYSFRKRKQKELDEAKIAIPALDVGHEAVAADENDTKPGEGRVEGMGLGRYYGRVRQDKKGSRSSAVGVLLGGYYGIVRTSVVVSFCTRTTLGAVLLYTAWKRFKRS